MLVILKIIKFKYNHREIYKTIGGEMFKGRVSRLKPS